MQTVKEGYEEAKFNPQELYKAYNLSAEQCGKTLVVGSTSFASGEIISYTDKDEYINASKKNCHIIIPAVLNTKHIQRILL